MCHTCQRGLRAKYVPASHFYVPINVLTCQCAKRGVSFSIRRANVPTCSIFFHFACQKVCQCFNYFSEELYFFICRGDPEILKRGGTLCVDHHGWPAKKSLVFRWSKKAEITLETISFWQNISISSQ